MKKYLLMLIFITGFYLILLTCSGWAPYFNPNNKKTIFDKDYIPYLQNTFPGIDGYYFAQTCKKRNSIPLLLKKSGNFDLNDFDGDGVTNNNDPDPFDYSYGIGNIDASDLSLKKLPLVYNYGSYNNIGLNSGYAGYYQNLDLLKIFVPIQAFNNYFTSINLPAEYRASIPETLLYVSSQLFNNYSSNLSPFYSNSSNNVYLNFDSSYFSQDFSFNSSITLPNAQSIGSTQTINFNINNYHLSQSDQIISAIFAHNGVNTGSNMNVLDYLYKSSDLKPDFSENKANDWNYSYTNDYLNNNFISLYSFSQFLNDFYKVNGNKFTIEYIKTFLEKIFGKLNDAQWHFTEGLYTSIDALEFGNGNWIYTDSEPGRLQIHAIDTLKIGNLKDVIMAFWRELRYDSLIFNTVLDSTANITFSRNKNWVIKNKNSKFGINYLSNDGGKGTNILKYSLYGSTDQIDYDNVFAFIANISKSSINNKFGIDIIPYYNKELKILIDKNTVKTINPEPLYFGGIDVDKGNNQISFNIDGCRDYDAFDYAIKYPCEKYMFLILGLPLRNGNITFIASSVDVLTFKPYTMIMAKADKDNKITEGPVEIPYEWTVESKNWGITKNMDDPMAQKWWYGYNIPSLSTIDCLNGEKLLVNFIDNEKLLSNITQTYDKSKININNVIDNGFVATSPNAVYQSQSNNPTENNNINTLLRGAYELKYQGNGVYGSNNKEAKFYINTNSYQNVPVYFRTSVKYELNNPRVRIDYRETRPINERGTHWISNITGTNDSDKCNNFDVIFENQIKGTAGTQDSDFTPISNMRQYRSGQSIVILEPADPNNDGTGGNNNINTNRGTGICYYFEDENIQPESSRWLCRNLAGPGTWEYNSTYFNGNGTPKDNDHFLQTDNEGKLHFYVPVVNNGVTTYQPRDIYIRAYGANIRPGDDYLLKFKLSDTVNIQAREKDFFAVYDKKMLWRANLYIDDRVNGLTDWNDLDKNRWNSADNEWNYPYDGNTRLTLDSNLADLTGLNNGVHGDGGQVITIKPYTRYPYHGAGNDNGQAVSYAYGCHDTPFEFNSELYDQMTVINYFMSNNMIYNGINYGALGNSWNLTTAPGDNYSNYARPIPETYANDPVPLAQANTMINDVQVDINGTPYIKFIPGRSSWNERNHSFWINAISSGVDCIGFAQMSASYNGNPYIWTNLNRRHNPLDSTTWGLVGREYPKVGDNLSWEITNANNVQVDNTITGGDKIVPGDIMYYPSTGEGSHIAIVLDVQYTLTGRKTTVNQISLIESNYIPNNMGRVINSRTLNYYTTGPNSQDWVVVRLITN